MAAEACEEPRFDPSEATSASRIARNATDCSGRRRSSVAKSMPLTSALAAAAPFRWASAAASSVASSAA